MILVLLIILPLLAGVLSFVVGGQGSKMLGLLASLAALVISLLLPTEVPLAFAHDWIPAIGAQMSLRADAMAQMLCILTSLVYVVLFIAQWNKEIQNPHRFYGLLLLTQAGLMGVFLSADMLLFYLFWEVALIPVYFLSSIWGGEKRIAVTFKFFVYTFLGSLLMLAGVIYLSLLNMGTASYSWENIVIAGNALPKATQLWLFVLLFLAFAIKMPIFPFHTWQPDAYEQAPTAVTIVLSALMVKMGIYAVLRWLLPVLPEGVAYWSDTVIILSIIGIIYASCLALVQDDMKRLIAYSSIAHMGLMSAAAFAHTQPAMHGLLVQMFNHGINIAGMWLIVSIIEHRYGTRKMSELGGIATAAPALAIIFVIVSFANIALPLTNGFVGEFMLFHGIFQSSHAFHIGYMVLAGLGVILGAVYTLTMVQKVAFGEMNGAVVVKSGLKTNEYIAMVIVVALIIALGVYPKPLLDLTATVLP